MSVTDGGGGATGWKIPTNNQWSNTSWTSANNGPISPEESKRINDQVWAPMGGPPATGSPFQAPDKSWWTTYRTVADPATGQVIPTSWGGYDTYGNYNAGYIAPGWQSDYLGDFRAGQTRVPANQSYVPAPSYIPHPIDLSQSLPQPAPAPPPAQQSSGSDQSSASAPAQPAPAQQTPWDIWQQNMTLAQNPDSLPAPSQTSDTVRKQGPRNTTLANAVLQGGTSYKPGNNAAAFNQDVSDYQQKQNEFATTYQLMLQRLAQESGGLNSYTPGATG